MSGADELGLNEEWGSDDEEMDDEDDTDVPMYVEGAPNPASSPYPLHDAAEAGDVERLRDMLARLASQREALASNGGMISEPMIDLDERDDDGCTPLHVALLSRSLPCVELLLEAGAEVRYACEGSPVVHIALSVGSIPSSRTFALGAVRVLVARGASARALDDRHRTTLHLAALHGLDECCSVLLENGAVDVVNIQDREGRTALHAASAARSEELLQLLLTHGADPALVDSAGLAPLHVAAARGFTMGVAALLVAGGSLAARDARGWTAAKWAERCGRSAGLVAVLNNTDDDAAAAAAAATAAEEVEDEDDEGGDDTESAGERGRAGSRRTLLLWHPQCERHYTCSPAALDVRGEDVPAENVKRLRVLLEPGLGILRCSRLEKGRMQWAKAPRAQMSDVLRVHDYAYVKTLQELCAGLPDAERTQRVGELDGDTTVSDGTFEAAMRAAGSVVEAVDRVVLGTHRNVFCAVRPPGHHAGPRPVRSGCVFVQCVF